jgi:hypothetical protein
MQNYQLTPKNQKLKIETTVQVLDTVSVDVDLPYFCKNCGVYFKVVNESKALRVTNYLGHVAIIVSNPSHSHTAQEIASSTAITENEFDVFVHGALSEVDELVDYTTDPNEQIDQMIQDKIDRREAI